MPRKKCFDTGIYRGMRRHEQKPTLRRAMMAALASSTTQLSRFEHMTSSVHARGAERVLRILCKHFGKFPGQTLPVHWLALEWASTLNFPVDRSEDPEANLDIAVEYGIQHGWLVRRTVADKTVIELTEAGYRCHNGAVATHAPSTNVPRELLKRLKNKD